MFSDIRGIPDSYTGPIGHIALIVAITLVALASGACVRRMSRRREDGR